MKKKSGKKAIEFIVEAMRMLLSREFGATTADALWKDIMGEEEEVREDATDESGTT